MAKKVLYVGGFHGGNGFIDPFLVATHCAKMGLYGYQPTNIFSRVPEKYSPIPGKTYYWDFLKPINLNKDIVFSLIKRKNDISLNIDENYNPTIVGNINDSDLQSNSFDCIFFERIPVYSNFGFNYYQNNNGQDNLEPNFNAIAESYRLLKEKGTLCILTGSDCYTTAKQFIEFTGKFYLVSCNDKEYKMRFLKI